MQLMRIIIHALMTVPPCAVMGYVKGLKYMLLLNLIPTGALKIARPHAATISARRESGLDLLQWITLSGAVI